MVFSQAKGINWVAVSIIWLTLEHWMTFLYHKDHMHAAQATVWHRRKNQDLVLNMRKLFDFFKNLVSDYMNVFQLVMLSCDEKTG